MRTRIPVWVLVRARQLGTSEADILLAYPSLAADDLTNAWASSYGDEIDEPPSQGVSNGLGSENSGAGRPELRSLRVMMS